MRCESLVQSFSPVADLVLHLEILHQEPHHLFKSYASGREVVLVEGLAKGRACIGRASMRMRVQRAARRVPVPLNDWLARGV